MQIMLNGKRTRLFPPITIADLVREKGLDPTGVVVEHNLKIIDAADWDRILLKEDDALEVLAFVGGG